MKCMRGLFNCTITYYVLYPYLLAPWHSAVMEHITTTTTTTAKPKHDMGVEMRYRSKHNKNVVQIDAGNVLKYLKSEYNIYTVLNVVSVYLHGC